MRLRLAVDRLLVLATVETAEMVMEVMVLVTAAAAATVAEAFPGMKLRAPCSTSLAPRL